MKTLMLNGKEVQVDNFGADPKKEGFNRFSVNVPVWDELGRTVKTHLNALSIDQAGYEHAITVLTQIKADVIKQKFYEINPSDFMPVVVGEGAWMQNLVFNSVYLHGGDFEAGVTDSSRPFNKKPATDIEIVAKAVPIFNWNMAFSYSIMEVTQAAKGNVDVVTQMEEARKKLWDLGIQRVAFLGSKTRPTVIRGLLTVESAPVDTAIINEPLSGMTADEYTAFVATILGAYGANVNYTVKPDTFVMPEVDFLGMAAPYSSAYPLISKLEYLQKAFESVCGKGFKIMSTAYANKAQMTTAGVSHYRYAMYRNKPETLELNIPVAYTTTAFGTPNGFDFENVAMGQFSGVYGKRPAEIQYFDDDATG